MDKGLIYVLAGNKTGSVASLQEVALVVNSLLFFDTSSNSCCVLFDPTCEYAVLDLLHSEEKEKQNMKQIKGRI